METGDGSGVMKDLVMTDISDGSSMQKNLMEAGSAIEEEEIEYQGL